MGSKPFLKDKNCLLLVSYSVKIWVLIQSAQKLMGSRTFLSKLLVSAKPVEPMLTKPLHRHQSLKICILRHHRRRRKKELWACILSKRKGIYFRPWFMVIVDGTVGTFSLSFWIGRQSSILIPVVMPLAAQRCILTVLFHSSCVMFMVLSGDCIY